MTCSFGRAMEGRHKHPTLVEHCLYSMTKGRVLINVALVSLLHFSVGESASNNAPFCRRLNAAFHAPLGRRAALEKAVASVSTGLVSTILIPPSQANAEENGTVGSYDTPAPIDLPFTAYSIKPDSSASLNPSLRAIENKKLIHSLATTKGGTLWLGEHHNSEKDHQLQSEFIRMIHAERAKRSSGPMAIGLEQVQVQFQDALDDFVAGRASHDDLKRRVEWESRWVWPFEVYVPVFNLARELNIRLIALNVDSEDLSKVEKYGYEGLPKPLLQKYITDPAGFASFAKPKEYSAYVNYVIRPSYDLHRAMGLLKNTMSGEKLDQEMSFRNFFSGRILWDEAMASAACKWTRENPGGLLVGLVGADHVKFKNGIPGRYSRLVAGSRDCTSVILNPTLIDSRPAGTVMNMVGSDSSQYPDKITLQLRYLKEGVDESSEGARSPSNTGGVLPLADYVVIS